MPQGRGAEENAEAGGALQAAGEWGGRLKRLPRPKRRKGKDEGERKPKLEAGETVHCIVCRAELELQLFSSDPPCALLVLCCHRLPHPACAGCEVEARHRVRVHDQTGSPVQSFGPVTF